MTAVDPHCGVEPATTTVTVWRLGDPDAGPTCFQPTLFGPGAGDPAPFTVGESDERTHWSAFHPGPLDGTNGFREASQTIVFSLPSPDTDHELLLHIYASHGPCPQLEVTINGRRGLYFLDAVRSDRTRITSTSPICGWAFVSVPIPRGRLREGENSIRFTTIQVDGRTPDELDRIPHPAYPASHFGSGFLWSSIELRAVPAAADDPTIAITALPLYVDRAGVLHELIDLIVAAPTGCASGRLRGRIGSHPVDAELGACDHGQVRIRLEVPEFPAGTPADIEVELDGRTASLSATLDPARKWTLHILPHVHLDIGYTDYQGKVLEVHSRNLERVLQILDRTPDYAFSVDGSMVLDETLATRTPAVGRRIVEAARDGRVGINPFYALFLTGLPSLEEMFRAAYQGLAAADRHGLEMDVANLTDVPSYSWALPSVLAELGIGSFMGIVNHCRAGNEEADEIHLASPFRWEGADGRAVLAWFADSYSQVRYLCGDPPTLAGAADGLSRFARRYDRADYSPSDLPIVGIAADNEDLGDGEHDFVQRWNSRYAYPHLRTSTIADYMRAVRPHWDALPRMRGDGGSYWEDGVGANAAAIASYRSAQTAVLDAETLGALLAVAGPTLKPHRERLNQAWQALLIGCEHTWTSAHATASPHSHAHHSQAHWKETHIEFAGVTATEEVRRSLSQLGDLVTTAGPAIVVVNQLGWPRDAEIEVEVPAGQVPDGVECEIVERHGSLNRLRLEVEAVPAFGYRCVPLRSGAGPSAHVVPCDGPQVVESGRYRMTIDAEGQVQSLHSMTLNRELVDSAGPWRLGQVLYVSGGGTAHGRGLGDERTSLYESHWYLPEPDLTITPADLRLLAIEGCGDGVRLRFRGRGRSLPRVELVVRLRDRSDRVDFDYVLDKEHELAKESVYVAFPFDVGEHPVVRYDRQLGWVDPRIDHQPGAANEWFTSLYGVGLDGEIGLDWVACHSPLFTLGDIVRGTWPTTTRPRNGTLLSWVMNNHWFTNFAASQGGEVRLSYSFRPQAAWDPISAARFGREVRHPAAATAVSWLDKIDTRPRRLPADGAVLLPLELPDNVTATAHVSQDGSRLVVRLVELAGRPAQVRLPNPPGTCRPTLRLDGAERERSRLGAGEAVELSGFGVATIGWLLDRPPS